jgi:SAM-dependent methyltransferase
MPDDPPDIVESGTTRSPIGTRRLRAGRGPETYSRSFLARVLDLIPNGGTFLDLGCGAGLVTADLTTRARVVGVHISLAQLELARRNPPAARFARADMVGPRARAGIVRRGGVLDADPRPARVPRVLARGRPHVAQVRRPVRGDARSGDNPADHVPDFHGAPMYWSHFDAENNRRLLREAGFDVLQADEIEDEGETPLWVVAKA